MAIPDDMQGFSDWLSKTSEPGFGSGPSTASPIGPSAPAVPASAPPAASTGPATTAIQGQDSTSVATVPAITAAQSAATQDPTADKQPSTQPNAIAPSQPGKATPPSTVNSVTDLFNIAPELKSAFQSQEKFNQAYVDQTANVLDTIGRIIPLKEQAAQDLTNVKSDVAQTIVGATKDVQTRVVPIDQQLQAVKDRQEEIVTGNPFLMFFKGIMDKNYRPDYLAEKANALSGQRAAANQTYEDIVNTNVRRMQAAQSDYEGKTTLFDTQMSDVDAKAKAAGAVAQGYAQIAATHVAEITSQQDLQVAQHTAKVTLLDSMTQQQANEGYAKAKASPDGTTTINGIQLSAGELLKTSDDWSAKNLALQQQHNAVTLQSMEVADKSQQQWANHASMPELINAQATGMLPNGHPVNHAIIADAMLANQTANQNTISAIRQQGVAPVYQSSLYSTAANNAMSEDKERQAFGAPTAAHDAFSRKLALTATQIGETVRAAAKISPEAQQQAMVDGTKQMDALKLEHDKIIHDDAVRFGGTNKDTTAWMESYLGNQFLDAPTAVRAVIATHRSGGQLPGLTTPSAIAMMSRVGKIIDAYDNATGPSTDGGLPGQRQKERNSGFISADLMSAVGKEMNSQHVGDSLNNMAAASTRVAGQIIMPNGQPHPASQISDQTLFSANKAGQAAGMDWLKTTLGLTKDQAQEVYDQQDKSRYWQNFVTTHPKGMVIDGETKPVSLPAVMGSLQAHEAQSTLMALGPQAADYVDLWRNNDFMKRMMVSHDSSKQLSPGDYAIHAVAGTQVPAGIVNYSQRLTNAWSKMNDAGVKQRLATLGVFRAATPVDAARLTLYTDPKIKQHEADALMGYLTPKAQQLAQASGIPVADALDSLMKQKLPDPTLDRIRKIASQDWDVRRQATDEGVNNWVRANNWTNVNDLPLGSTSQQQLEHQLEGQPGMTIPMGGR